MYSGKLIFRTVFCLLSSASLFTCTHNELVYNKPALQLDLDKNELNADGYAKATVTIKMLASAVDTANRKVTIQTDAGTFQSDKPASGKINIYLDPGKDSTLYLIVGKKPGTFPITAFITKLPQYAVSKELTLDTITANQIITINIPNPSAKANGKDILSGTLTLKNVRSPSVTLSTSDATGTFSISNTTTWTPQIPVDNVVNFQLRAGSSPGDYYVTAKLNDDRNFAVTFKYTLTSLSGSDVLDLSLPSATQRADSVSVINGVVRIKDTNQTSVILTTNNGLFLPERQNITTLQMDADHSKSFQLQVGDNVPIGGSSILYSLKATSGNYSITNDLNVSPAYPDTAYVFPQSYSIDKTAGSVNIKVRFLRSVGVVSDGIQIVFKAFQSTASGPVEVGRFNGIPAFTKDQVVSVAFLTDTRSPDPSLPIHLDISFKNDSGASKSQRIDLKVNP